MVKKLVIYFSIFSFIILISGLFASRNNPPIENKVTWDSDETKEQFMISCANCHSNENKMALVFLCWSCGLRCCT
jgi:hypothetical protein